MLLLYCLKIVFFKYLINMEQSIHSCTLTIALFPQLNIMLNKFKVLILTQCNMQMIKYKYNEYHYQMYFQIHTILDFLIILVVKNINF